MWRCGELVAQLVAVCGSTSPFTWSEDVRTALLCYSLLKVYDQAMLTSRDAEGLVLVSCLWLRDDLCVDLGEGHRFISRLKDVFVTYVCSEMQDGIGYTKGCTKSLRWNNND